MKGASACCQVNSEVPDIIHAEINGAISQIRDHLSNDCSIDLKNATFYFKYDKKDHLYLVYAAGIQAMSTTHSEEPTQEPGLA